MSVEVVGLYQPVIICRPRAYTRSIGVLDSHFLEWVQSVRKSIILALHKSTKIIVLVPILFALRAHHPQILTHNVGERQGNLELDGRSCFGGLRPVKRSLHASGLNLTNKLLKHSVSKERALLSLQIHHGALEQTPQVIVCQRLHADLATLNVCVLHTIRAHADLYTGRSTLGNNNTLCARGKRGI